MTCESGGEDIGAAALTPIEGLSAGMGSGSANATATAADSGIGADTSYGMSWRVRENAATRFEVASAARLVDEFERERECERLDFGRRTFLDPQDAARLSRDEDAEDEDDELGLDFEAESDEGMTVVEDEADAADAAVDAEAEVETELLVVVLLVFRVGSLSERAGPLTAVTVHW
jgi:hypothetical protein